MTTASKSWPHTVIYDPDAVAELLTTVKSKEEHRAILQAVLKLQELGERLGPPHMKPLKGAAAATLRELRPKQGRSDWRAVYRRSGSIYVVLAIDRHKNFATLVERARARAARYEQQPLESR
ncbi:MAG: type II toxin-antitoxin system RelE/ParE family toxin [Solirubrobacteraceae bacterium]